MKYEPIKRGMRKYALATVIVSYTALLTVGGWLTGKQCTTIFLAVAGGYATVNYISKNKNTPEGPQ